MMPAGKSKKIKVLMKDQFMVNDRPILQLGILQTIKYLSVWFSSEDLQYNAKNVGPLLEKVRRAPLKP